MAYKRTDSNYDLPVLPTIPAACIVANSPDSLTSREWTEFFAAVEAGATGIIAPLRPERRCSATRELGARGYTSSFTLELATGWAATTGNPNPTLRRNPRGRTGRRSVRRHLADVRPCPSSAERYSQGVFATPKPERTSRRCSGSATSKRSRAAVDGDLLPISNFWRSGPRTTRRQNVLNLLRIAAEHPK